jgi:hypothetical protein
VTACCIMQQRDGQDVKNMVAEAPNADAVNLPLL